MFYEQVKTHGTVPSARSSVLSQSHGQNSKRFPVLWRYPTSENLLDLTQQHLKLWYRIVGIAGNGLAVCSKHQELMPSSAAGAGKPQRSQFADKLTSFDRMPSDHSHGCSSQCPRAVAIYAPSEVQAATSPPGSISVRARTGEGFFRRQSHPGVWESRRQMNRLPTGRSGPTPWPPRYRWRVETSRWENESTNAGSKEEGVHAWHTKNFNSGLPWILPLSSPRLPRRFSQATAM